MSKERMFEAELLNQQLENIQQYLARLEKQTAEVHSLKAALDEFGTVVEGQEMLVPLAAGVFVKAIAVEDKSIHVNVGNGVVVPKTVASMHQMLDEQLSEMKAYEQELQGQFDQMLARLSSLQAEFK
jgi:prefoldin alpha subunit